MKEVERIFGFYFKSRVNLYKFYNPHLDKNLKSQFGLFWTIIFNLTFLYISQSLLVEDRRMRNKTNLLVFSLSFADFLNTAFNTTFNFIYMTQRLFLMSLM